jgi:hypothetical protein
MQGVAWSAVIEKGKLRMVKRMEGGTGKQTNKNKTNSVALVRKRTIPTERPPLVGEVSANFSG